ncbi:MAG: CbtA family protein, partial [Actinomycetospora chiangmaiensis]|nr:CbtA family protein [Actinomycetospora chiangmaiensis]
MILRLLSAALAAGFLAAIVATGLELALTSPLIVAAERYETPAPGQAAEVRPHALPIVLAHAGHDHAAPDAAPEWQPAPGFQRMAFTGLGTLVGGVGWALLLGAALIACG